MERLITIAVVTVSVALGAQTVERDATKMTVKVKPAEHTVTEPRLIDPVIQKGPNRPRVVATDDKSISEKGLKRSEPVSGDTPR